MGRPSAKERKPYNLDAILDVAVRVFRERGYDGSTLDDVARAAGITKASIYYHVRSKEELLARGVGRALDALFAVLDERPSKQGRAEARLRYIVHRTIEITVEQLPEVALLLRVRGNTPVERRIMERRRAFDHLIARVMRNAQRQGDLRADVEPRLATRLLFGMLNSITEWYRPGGGLDAPEVAEAKPDRPARSRRDYFRDRRSIGRGSGDRARSHPRAARRSRRDPGFRPRQERPDGRACPGSRGAAGARRRHRRLF